MDRIKTKEKLKPKTNYLSHSQSFQSCSTKNIIQAHFFLTLFFIILFLNFKISYRERWRDWPCEAAATGKGILFV